MIKIYKYNAEDKDYRAIVNSGLEGTERDKALEEWVKANGKAISIMDYFSTYDRHSYYGHQYPEVYTCYGTPENCIERLVNAELQYDGDLSYCWVREASPEDLIESRTDWDEMKSYADGLAGFISALKSEIAEGIIKVSKPRKKEN